MKEKKEYTVTVEFKDPMHPVDQPLVRWGNTYVLIGVVKEIDEKPVTLWIYLDLYQKESEIEISYFQAQIDRFANLYGADINQWRQSIQTVLDNIATMLSEYDDLDRLTAADFYLLVDIAEVEGQMLHDGDCFLKIDELNIEALVDLSGTTAEVLADTIRERY